MWKLRQLPHTPHNSASEHVALLERFWNDVCKERSSADIWVSTYAWSPCEEQTAMIGILPLEPDDQDTSLYVPDPRFLYL